MGWFKKKSTDTNSQQKSDIGRAVAKGILASIAGDSSILSAFDDPKEESQESTQNPENSKADKK